jgi:uncharacterized protein (TIGR02466 family)
MSKYKSINNENPIVGLFSTPLMKIQLDLDLEKLTEFTFQLQDKDKIGDNLSNRGGWQSTHQQTVEVGEKHQEFIKLKKEISQQLQIYHSTAFRGVEFDNQYTRGNELDQTICSIWANINEKYHYNDWHIHSNVTLSGVFYIKHDGSVENGNIKFKHPVHHFPYIMNTHFRPGIFKRTNEVTSEIISVLPKPNMLLIFPSWLEHMVEPNLNNDSRISISFNSIPVSKYETTNWKIK